MEQSMIDLDKLEKEITYTISELQKKLQKIQALKNLEQRKDDYGTAVIEALKESGRSDSPEKIKQILLSVFNTPPVEETEMPPEAPKEPAVEEAQQEETQPSQYKEASPLESQEKESPTQESSDDLIDLAFLESELKNSEKDESLEILEELSSQLPEDS